MRIVPYASISSADRIVKSFKTRLSPRIGAIGFPLNPALILNAG
jgi:hypothetical protein